MFNTIAYILYVIVVDWKLPIQRSAAVWSDDGELRHQDYFWSLPPAFLGQPQLWIRKDIALKGGSVKGVKPGVAYFLRSAFTGPSWSMNTKIIISHKHFI